MVQSGFIVGAGNAVLASLAPAFAQDATKGGAKSYTRSFRGTGGELLAEQLREAGVEYLFAGNGTGVSPLCDAVVDRPDLKIILAVHEGLCVAMADGYARASGKTAFSMFSRVAVPHVLQHVAGPVHAATLNRFRSGFRPLRAGCILLPNRGSLARK